MTTPDDAPRAVTGSPRRGPLLSMSTTADSSHLSEIRHAVMEHIRTNGGHDDLVDDVGLIVSELATNVIHHTTSDVIAVMVQRQNGDWVIEVADAENIPRLDTLPVPDPMSVTGRGLFVVQSLADSVDVVERDGTAVIRCRRSSRR